MSDEFDSLGATLIRCRVLAAKIANELRNKRPEHFDKLSLADLYASLEHAARVLEQAAQKAVPFRRLQDGGDSRGAIMNESSRAKKGKNVLSLQAARWRSKPRDV